MTAPTHIAFGLLTVASSFSLFSVSIHRNLPAIACAIIGSLLPDLDSPRSYIGRVMPFASIPIERRWGHRTITHSLLCMLALSVVTLPLLAWDTACYAAILLGYMSHLIADSATKSGVPLFYPHPAVCVFPNSARYRVKTGSLMGEGTGIGCGSNTAPGGYAHIEHGRYLAIIQISDGDALGRILRLSESQYRNPFEF